MSLLQLLSPQTNRPAQSLGPSSSLILSSIASAVLSLIEFIRFLSLIEFIRFLSLIEFIRFLSLFSFLKGDASLYHRYGDGRIRVLHALVNGETGVAYSNVLALLRFRYPHITPSFIMSDMSPAIAKAAREVMPDVRHLICAFHLKQAFCRQIAKLSVARRTQGQVLAGHAIFSFTYKSPRRTSNAPGKDSKPIGLAETERSQRWQYVGAA